MNKKNILSIAIVVLVVGMAVGFTLFKQNKNDMADNVALVNGVAISKSFYGSQLATAITSFKSQGVAVEDPAKLVEIRTQVLDNLINDELVAQGIVKAGIKITPEQIEAQYQVILNQAGDADKLKVQLDTAKIDEAQLRENISKQLAIQAYLLQNVDVGSVTVTDEEIQKFYDDNTKDQKDVPVFKDVSEQIKQQLLSNKQQLLVNTFLTKLREGATIETNLK